MPCVPTFRASQNFDDENYALNIENEMLERLTKVQLPQSKEFAYKGMKINNSNLQQAQVRIFPNPSTGNFSIDLSNFEEGIDNIEFFDVSGRGIKSISNLNYEDEISLNLDLIEGTYFVKVAHQNRNYMEKLVIKK